MSEPRGLVVGTAGHVDHGKTSLVRALTGVETDRWKEERERGLTIDLGFARLPLDDDLEVGVVDVPGHEDFLKNMLAGATGVDLLLLVVAADEGPMPQTHEHLAIARLLGVERGVVALSKIDRVDPEWLELARETTRELLHGPAGRERWPIVPVSAESGEGLDALREALRAQLAEVPGRSPDDLFRLPVDRSFTIHGTGTVVTGTVWSGRVEAGAAVRVLPGDRSVRVRALQVHGESRAAVPAGRRCALALVGVDPGDAPRGAVLVAEEGWREVSRLGARLRILARPGRAIEHGQRVRIYLGTREVMARVFLPDGATLPPGTDGWAALGLEEPLVARARDRFIVRFFSPVTTIGGGRVADLDPPHDWGGRVDAWARLLDGDPREAVRAAVRLAGTRGLARPAGPIATGLAPRTFDAAAHDDDAIVLLGKRWFDPTARDRAVERVLRAVERLQRERRRASAVSLEAVRATVTGACAPALVDDALERLTREGRLAIDGPRVARPDHSAELTPAEAAARERLATTIREGGLQPPPVSDLARILDLERGLLDDLLTLLRDEGRVEPVTPELQLDAGVLEGAVGAVRELLADGEPAPPTRFKERFGLSRKYLIPLLEYLDRRGVTRRTGEGRVLADR